jgi:hypothetical protein
MNYYNFLISTTENKLKIAKIRSEDGTATGTGLINQNGESIHPSISSFISQAGITIDPPVGKIPLSYLSNYISTTGCTQVQSTFVASQHNLSFLPAKIKALYEPQVTSTKIQFETPNSKTVILEDRPGRIIDYTFPDQGSVGENYDYDDVAEICQTNGTHTNCQYKVDIDIYPNVCSPNFFLNIQKTVLKRCTCEEEFNKNINNKECAQYPPTGDWGYRSSNQKINIEKEQQKQSFTADSCVESTTVARLNIEWRHDDTVGNRVTNYSPKARFSGYGEISNPATVLNSPGIGVTLLEAGISLATDLINPVGGAIKTAAGITGAAASVAGGSSGGVVSDVASTIANPVGAVVKQAFNFINESLTERLEDVAAEVSTELKNIQSKCKKSSKSDSECSTCIEKEVTDSMKNKNSKLSKLMDKIISNSGITPCC